MDTTTKPLNQNKMKAGLIIFLSILFFPISLPYWFAWAMIEVIREDDSTIWTENPLTFKSE